MDIPSPVLTADARRLLLYVPGLILFAHSQTPALEESLAVLYSHCSDPAAVASLLTNPAVCLADAITGATALALV